MIETYGLPFRATTTIAEYDEGLNPDIDPPSRVREEDFWFEADGTLVLDPERIAQIEAGIVRLEEQYAEPQG